MKINLILTAKDFDDVLSQDLTRDLCTAINNEEQIKINASIGEQKSKEGEKGDPATIGAIVLAVLGTGGGAVALINVFKAFVDRNKEISIKLKKQSGDEIEINTKNIDSDEVKLMMDNILSKE